MSVQIRHECAEDAQAIHDLTARAFAPMPFAGGDEQLLPARFRSANVLALSLVAELGGKVIGQLTLTPAIAADSAPGWFALGPISVDPDYQKHGIGSRMIAAAIGWLKSKNAAGCALVGNPAYYGRFGWRPAPDLTPAGEPAEYYQILPLADAEPKTIISFHPLFYGPTA
jgi:putative acetyltransferase